MKHIKYVVFTTVGIVLVLIGLALLVLPGPGLLVVLVGLVTLATVFPRLDRHVQVVRRHALKAADDSVSSGWRLAGATVLGVLMIAAGVAWALIPGLPFGGWHTGASVILSGLVVLGLLAYSHRRVRGERHS